MGSHRARANGEHWQPAPAAQGWRYPRGGGSCARGAEREEAEDDPRGGRCSAGHRRGARNLGLPGGAWRRADGQARDSGAQGPALFSLPPRRRRSGVVRSAQDTALGREGEDVSLIVVARGRKESPGWKQPRAGYCRARSVRCEACKGDGSEGPHLEVYTFGQGCSREKWFRVWGGAQGLAAGGTLRPRALDPGGAALGVTNSIVTHLLRLTAAAKPSPDLLPSAFSANNGAGAGKAASRLQSLHLRPLLCSSVASEPGK